MRTQLDIETEVFYLPNHTQPPCSFNSETRDAVCLPQFPTRNYDFRLPGDEISHGETRKYDFPSPKTTTIAATAATTIIIPFHLSITEGPEGH